MSLSLRSSSNQAKSSKWSQPNPPHIVSQPSGASDAHPPLHSIARPPTLLLAPLRPSPSSPCSHGLQMLCDSVVGAWPLLNAHTQAASISTMTVALVLHSKESQVRETRAHQVHGGLSMRGELRCEDA